MTKKEKDILKSELKDSLILYSKDSWYRTQLSTTVYLAHRLGMSDADINEVFDSVREMDAFIVGIISPVYVRNGGLTK